MWDAVAKVAECEASSEHARLIIDLTRWFPPSEIVVRTGPDHDSVSPNVSFQKVLMSMAIKIKEA